MNFTKLKIIISILYVSEFKYFYLPLMPEYLPQAIKPPNYHLIVGNQV